MVLLIRCPFLAITCLYVFLFSACSVPGSCHTLLLIPAIGLRDAVIDNPSLTPPLPASAPARLNNTDEEIEMSSDCQSPTACKLYNQISNPVFCSFKTNGFILQGLSGKYPAV